MAPSLWCRRVAVAATAWVVWTLWAAVPSHADPERAAVRDPGCGTLVLVLRPDVRVYRLPRGFLSWASDSARVGATWWRRNRDYVLEPLRGELRLEREPLPHDTLRLEACWLLAPPPLEFQLNAYRARPVPRDSAIAVPGRGGRPHPIAARDPSSAPAGASLALSGNKTIAVDFGSNQDAFLRQSLDLAVSGTLAPGVELTGVLSDRNVPGGGLETTRDLEALDRVLIELKAPRGSASLGDVSWSLDQGDFARVERRLQGVAGEWRARGFSSKVAAASAPGEFFRFQFFGADGRQGPYGLTDRDGNTGVTVVAGSEVVTVDGTRMSRGESADYAIDYERARVTFSNRRPISSVSRITVEYQYTVARYRRNLLSAGGRWEGARGFGFVQTLTEGDDRGRPVDLALSAEDRVALQAAGDSAALALASGVTPGVGDYDTLSVSAAGPVFVYAGPDSGEFAVRFARAPSGDGDYAESGTVGGRSVFRYVGAGLGSHRVGKALPLPESRRLWSAGGGMSRGPLALELEGASSSRDRNLFSVRDDSDNHGEAGRLTLKLAGTPSASLGASGLEVRARAVGSRFESFAPLERPFAEEDWGLPGDADLERQRRVDVSGFAHPRHAGEVRMSVGRLALPSGFSSLRRMVEWTRNGARLLTHGSFERADGTDPERRFESGGRERWRGEARFKFPWLEPALRFESDARRVPSDTGRVGDRFREATLDLESGAAAAWRLRAGYGLRREALARATGYDDAREARTLKLGVDSPAGKSLGVGLNYRRRAVEPLDTTPRSVSDLGSLTLWGEHAPRGLEGRMQIEITDEGESRRERRLTFVGPGLGGYDALGNFVGQGDYDLVVVVSATLERLSHTATSLGLGWRPGGSGARGSRIGFDFESETRRRGGLDATDPWVSAGAVRGDAGLARARVLQRLEVDLAPGSKAAAVRLRAERTVNADRSFENFVETREDRTLDGRWRARPGSGFTSELAVRHREQTAGQALSGSPGFARTLLEDGGQAQLVYAPHDRWRAVAALDLSYRKPESGADATRTIRLGPDLGLAVGPRGRAELKLRRGFVSGPPTPGLLPGPESLDAPRWEGDGRFDYRMREGLTFSLSTHGRDRIGARPLVTGRLEARAFF